MNTGKVMEWTGERFSPLSITGTIEPEHWHRYALARQFVASKDVLDIASGEGYGSHYLAEKAKSVIGVDISPDAVNFSREKYISPNLEYRNGNCAAIPLADHSVDVVVSFETIEHHDQHEEMFLEIRRVLRPGGLLILSSPDKLNFSEIPNIRVEFHIKELYRHEFENLVKKHFKHYSIVGQRLISGSLIAPESGFLASQKQVQTGFDYIENEEGPMEENWIKRSVYLIALASDKTVPDIAWSVLESDYLHRQLRAQEETMISMNRSLANSEAELARIYASKSWKLTGFFRFLASCVRNIIRKK